MIHMSYKKLLLCFIKKIGFDFWVISDLGSDDKTTDIIQETMISLGIPGKLINHG